jgi:hypothetical protein
VKSRGVTARILASNHVDVIAVELNDERDDVEHEDHSGDESRNQAA